MKAERTMFFYHPRIADYDFGPSHPLRPDRTPKTLAILQFLEPQLEAVDPGFASQEDVLSVHSEDYVETVRKVSSGLPVAKNDLFDAGFLSSDNPPFIGMFESSLAYCAGAVQAAVSVCDGGRLAFSLAGGLHHARRSQASGFCVFNDCAIACNVLRRKFKKVAYVDIDLHHGDGVQWIFYDDTSILTCSIHESGKFLYPGSGFVNESGTDFSSVNVPLAPQTTGDTWLWAFENGIMAALKAFNPDAVVLQMGADAHYSDPLGHLQVTSDEWLQAVQLVRDLNLPIVALGGGGYSQSVVPRMWASAVLTLRGMELPKVITKEHLARPIQTALGQTTTLGEIVPSGRMFDDQVPTPRNQGRAEAESIVSELHQSVVRHIR